MMNGEHEKEAAGVASQTEATDEVSQDNEGRSVSSTEVSAPDEELLPALARDAVETYVRSRGVLEPPAAPDSSVLRSRAGCFVSIKTRHGDLRGCIGTIEPVKRNLARELIANAVSAATRDPRFLPVSEAELPSLRYSVDVLSEPEPAQFEDLDPSDYGVIVEDESGRRRGLLLPDIGGVETAAQQVEIAARKAGIAPGEPLRLFRFRVRRYREPAQTIQNKR